MADVRYFTWDRPFLPAVASSLAQEWTVARGVDLSEVLVVVPGARAGRRLLELLLEAASARHLRLIPPCRILTIGSLPEEIYQPPSPLAHPATVHRAWIKALEATPSEVRESALGPLARGDLEPGVSLGFSRLLDSLHRTVGAAGLSFESVARECREGFLFSDEERWNALGKIQEEMRKILGQAGQVDREAARRKAWGSGAIRLDRTLILVGVAQLPLLTRRMVECLQGPVVALVHAPEAEAPAFDDLGLLRTGEWRDREIPLSDQDLIVAEDPRDQAVRVRRCLEGRFRDMDSDQISIGVPDPALVPYLTRELTRAGYSSRYAEGDPVSSSPPLLLLKTVTDYLSSGRFEALEDLLRHPDLPRALLPELAPELADQFFLEHLPDRLPPVGRQGQEPGAESRSGGGVGSDEGLQRIRLLLHGPELLGRFQGQRPYSSWMPEILAFLSQAYGALRPEADPDHFRTVAEALGQVRDGAEAILNLPESLDESCPASQAIQLLVDQVRDGRIPPEQDESAVEMVGWLELQLDDAPVVLLTGVSDPFLPESVTAHPFLPNAIRRAIGVEHNESRYARDAYRLTTLVKSTHGRVIVTGRTTPAGDPVRPSRLLLTETGARLARRVLLLTGSGEEESDDAKGMEGEGRGESVAAVGGEADAKGMEGEGAAGRPALDSRTAGSGAISGSGATRSGFALPPTEFIPVPTIPRPFPVTGFRTLLKDPYLWAVQAVLGLRPAEFDLQELDPPTFGTVAHQVLELFAASPEARSVDPDEIENRLSLILREKVARRFGAHPLPAVSIQIEQLRHRLSRFAAWQARWRSQGWEILCAEARTPSDGVPFDVDGEPIFLSGRVDRIDRNRETGEWALLDFKTGDSAVSVASSRSRSGEWKDLQLPLYRTLLADLRRPDGTPLEASSPGAEVYLGYVHIPRSDTPVEEDLADWDEEVLRSARETARTLIRGLRVEGGARYRPGESGRGARGPMAAFLGQGFLEILDEGEDS